MKYLSLCSGIEAATVAWHPLGWEAVAYSEIERFPSEVLAHHYPHTPNLGDMTKFKEWSIESNVDVLVGGTPCQSFSVAGLRKGLDDPRGNLMLTYLAIADQYRPRWLVWENVPGVLSSNGGKDFGVFLGALGELGYGFAYRVLDAQYFGVAQRRRRVFVVGYLGDWRVAAAVLFERHSLQGHPAPSREKRQSVAASVGTSIKSSFDCGVELTGPLSARDYKDAGTDGMNKNSAKMIPVTKAWPAEISSTLNASFGSKQGLENQHINNDCPMFVPAQPIALAENTIGRQPQNGGNGDGFTDGGPMYTLNATGVHGVAQPIPFGVSEKPDVGHCLRSGASRADKHESTTYVAQPVYEMHGQDSRVRDLGETCSTVTSKWGTGGGNVPVTTQPMAFTTEQTPKYNHDQALTLTKQSPTGGGQPQCVMQSMAVRRLTPVECERLQGFPDNYTDIKSKGKPTPDGPRYKALGNSMAVPVMAWIGQRIQEVEAICKQNK
jgi:DNA (cytosine-5)-methyltransferase 1